MSVSQPAREKRTFYDTFEWTLWFNKQVLYHDGANTVCSTMNQGWMETTLAKEAAEAEPSPFPSRWPDGPLRKHLETSVGLRGLMPIAEINSSTRTVELMNADHKVVFRFELISLFESSNQRTPYLCLCHLRPLRGYDQEAAAILTQLKALGFSEVETGPLEQLLINSGRAPVSYTMQLVFGLRPEESCREALRDIARRMLSRVRSQEQGIIDDIDTEFLHHYRIWIRKIRSIFSLVKGAYPEADTERLKSQWGDLARATNKLRDLDVYLLNREHYLALLPENLQAGMNVFFEGIERERDQAHQDLSQHLQSKSYRKTIAALATFFTAPDKLPASEFSACQIKDFASQRIYRRYRHIRKASQKITPTTQDRHIHQLRIECKKLRYMLEFFGELYDQREFDTLMKDLKKAQNSLGKFNDYVAQQNTLLAYSAAHKQTMGVQQALSIGGLISVLNLAQLEERGAAERALDFFSKASVDRNFRRALQSSSADAA